MQSTIVDTPNLFSFHAGKVVYEESTHKCIPDPVKGKVSITPSQDSPGWYSFKWTSRETPKPAVSAQDQQQADADPSTNSASTSTSADSASANATGPTTSTTEPRVATTAAAADAPAAVEDEDDDDDEDEEEEEEDSLLLVPGDTIWKHVKSCQTGRVFQLSYKSSGQKYLFWMQYPNDNKDDDPSELSEQDLQCAKKISDFVKEESDDEEDDDEDEEEQEQEQEPEPEKMEVDDNDGQSKANSSSNGSTNTPDAPGSK